MIISSSHREDLVLHMVFKFIVGFLQASCGSMRPELGSIIRKHEFLDNESNGIRKILAR